MQAVKEILASLFSSKKFLLTLAAVLTWLIGHAGLDVSQDTLLPILVLIGVLVGAQGIADFGKEGTKALIKDKNEEKAANPPTA